MPTYVQIIVTEGHLLSAVYFINRGLVQILQAFEQVATLSDTDNFGLEAYRTSATSGKQGQAVSSICSM